MPTEQIASNIDGDTFRTKEDKIRVGYINTPESVHENEKLNTQEGEMASEFAKDIMPEGSQVTTHDYGKDHFGRTVAGVTRNINGVEVDYGLVALDQQMSTYYTKYGKHPDPMKHDQYKEYYSRLVPYQLGTSEEYPSVEELELMTDLQKKFQKTYSDFKEGEATQEQLDAVTAELYGDPQRVMRYRRALVRSNYEANKGNTNTLAGAMQLVLETNPEAQEQYNRAVRNGHLQFERVPEDEPTFWENAANAFSLMGSVSNVADTELLFDARKYGTDTELPDEELVKGLPDQYHAQILQQAERYNDTAALVLRDQLIEDIANNKQFDNMEWYAQFGYGALALVADPTSIVAAAPAIKVGQGVINMNRAWQTARYIGGKSIINGSPAGAKLTAWAAGGAIEGAITNVPMLMADHTYTARDYQLDILMDTAFGIGLGGVVAGGTKGIEYVSKIRESRKLEQEKILKQAEDEAREKQANDGKMLLLEDKRPKDKPAPNPELETKRQNVKAKANAAKAVNNVKTLAGLKFPEFAAITKVSKDGYNKATQSLRKLYPKNSAMLKLVNVGSRINKQATDETSDIIAQINSDILHIASAFPDGKVPKNISDAIQGVTFRQKTYSTNNALKDILTGDTANVVERLESYIKHLEGRENLWEGFDVVPMSRDDFYKTQGDLISQDRSGSLLYDFDEEGQPTSRYPYEDRLTKSLPKEFSYIADVIELNKMAEQSSDPMLTELVERLNGMVNVRMEQRLMGIDKRYSDSRQSWGKSVEMSAAEIAEQLRKEGLQPRTTEYSKRLKELRQRGRKEVKDEVNELGRYNSYNVGRDFTEVDPDAEQYYTLDDAKRELHELQKVPNPTDAQISQADYLRDFIDNSNNTRTTQLVKDSLDQDLLPRAYTETQTVEAYKNPTKANLEAMHNNLRSIGKKLGVFEIRGKKELKANQERLEGIARALTRDKDKVVQRMAKSGKWLPIEDVIRASAAIADAKEVLKKQQKAESSKSEKSESAKKPNEITVIRLKPEDLDVLDESNPTKGKTEEEVNAIKTAATDAYERLLEESKSKISKGLTDFVASGEKRAFIESKKPVGVLDRVGRMAAAITKDIGSKLQDSKITSLEYFGSRVTEIGRGYGGNIRRRFTGGIIRDAIYKESVMQIVPQYVRLIDDYAKAQGKNVVGRMNAQQQSGAHSKVVKQFNEDVFRVQELRRQGRGSEVKVHKSVTDFVDQWDKYMEYNMSKLVDANIGGFTGKNKVKHYIPHIWDNGKFLGAMNKHGEAKIRAVLRQGYTSAIKNGTNPASLDEVDSLVDNMMDNLQNTDVDTDQYLPVSDSRAKQRQDIDTLVSVDGLRLLDLLEDDVIGVGIKYSNRVGGWVGLSKSTDGMLTSQMDIDLFKENMAKEAKEQGADVKKYEQYYDDVINLMFGRPTRGGLNRELRQLKDLTALTRMGGLGTAQLIETGQVITRSVLNLSGKHAKKVIADNVRGAKSEDQLIREIQSISSLTDDIEWLDRQSVHLDQAELAKVNKVRQVSLWLADKATFWSWKAPASRLLGKTTGFNAIRRAQSRIAQASFTVDVARHFKYGKGVMGNARMADVGLTDIDGTDVDLEDVFKNIVEYDADGYPTKLNVEQWPPEAREKFQFAMLRDEAQQVQRTHVGELPPWMNSPLMSLVFQFRQMPIVATNKQLGRNMAFADKEAVTATLLNAAIAGMVRYSKFAVLGAGYAALSDSDVQEPNYRQMQTDKYIAQFGIFPDAKDLVMGAYQVGTSDKKTEQLRDEVMGQVPVLGLMSDYYNAATNEFQSREQIEAVQGLVPLGNTAYGDMVHTWFIENFGE
ncbi:putative internal virion protein [Alteromonas phage vB_AmeP_R8W]|uniref:Putative internal virion protein n=1 Tax=Alteromonas phage vB_AmeP_R8W TaxID=2774152 RepID=A0A8E4W8J5_9CAUD|nr:putative internal virion protein [Alteromonas phage vB_AmeP_R8W]